MKSTQQLKGFQAFTRFLSTLKPKDGNHEIWLKLGHNQIYVGEFNNSGKFQIKKTWLKNEGDPKSRQIGKPVGDAFDYLSEQCEKNDGGVFYIPTQPIGLPLADFVTSTDDIGIEMDLLTYDEQLAKYEQFQSVTGLTYSSLLTSGGKSIHAHIKAVDHLPVEQADYIRRLAVIAHLSDPVTARLHQPMRIPGFFRKDKGNYQTLLQYSDERYTYDQLIEGFKKWFAFQGWEFPDSLPEEWWQVLRPNFTTARNYTESERAEVTRQILAKGLDGWQQEQERVRQSKEQERLAKIERRKLYAVNGSGVELSDLVEEAEQRLGKDAFTLRNHDWQWSNFNKARGNCTFHTDSKSGNSGWIGVHPKSNKWTFACYSCTDNKPIGAFTYWLYNKYGFGSKFPTGKAYITNAIEFVEFAGIQVPDSIRNWKPQPAVAIHPASKPAIVKPFSIEDVERINAEVAANPRLALSVALDSNDDDERAALVEQCRKLAAFDQDGAVDYNLLPIKKLRKKVDELKKAEKFHYWLEKTKEIQAELSGMRYEPTISASGQYIPKGLMKLPSKSGIIILDATMGSGKTATAIKELVDQHKKLYPHALRWAFVPTNNLGLQMAQVIGLPHHWNKGKYDLPFEGVSCLESINKIDFDNIPNHPPLLILDEISALFKQILDGNTTKENQAFVIAFLRKLFHKVREFGGWVIASEDDVTNLEVEFIKACHPDFDVVEFLKFTKTSAHRQYINYTSPTQTWNEIEQRIGRGENLVIPSDSQKWLQETEYKLDQMGVKSYFLTSDTSDEDWAKEFASDPDAFIKSYKPQVIGFSPSFGSGGSIKDKDGYFSAVMFHLTHLEPRAAKQLTERLRTDVPRIGYIVECAKSEDDDFSASRPDSILYNLQRKNEGVEKLTNFAQYAEDRNQRKRDKGEPTPELIDVMIQIREKSHNHKESDYGFYLHFWSRYKARENFSKTQLRGNLVKIWESQGHNVDTIDAGVDEGQKQEREEYRDRLDQAYAVEFAASDCSDLTLDDARNLLDGMGTTREDRIRAKKRLFIDRLPMCNMDDPRFILKAVVKDGGDFLRDTEMLWLMMNPKAAEQLDRWNWYNAISNAAKDQTFVISHKLTNRSVQAKLLSECPLQPFIDGTVSTWNPQTAEAVKVKEWALFQSRRLKNHLRLTVSEKQSAASIVNKILRKIGYQTEEEGRAASGVGKEYRITNFVDSDRDIILNSLTQRFLKTLEKHEESIDTLPALLSVEEAATNESEGNNVPIGMAEAFKNKIIGAASKNDKYLLMELEQFSRLPKSIKQAAWDLMKGHPVRKRINRLLKSQAVAV